MKKGEQGEQPYAKFREQATRARANGKIALVRQILADKDWHAKAWYLEREPALLNILRARQGESTYFTRLPPGRLITCHTSRGAIVDLYLLDGAA
jgi:hypothetical protein